MNIGELWDEFIKYRTIGAPKIKLKPWRASTILEYCRFWGCSFKYFWANKKPDEIENNWEAFIEAERKRSKKGDNLGFAHHQKYMGTFVSYLVKQGVIDKKPLLFDPNWIKNENKEEKKVVIFTDEQARQMIEKSSGAFGLYIRMGLLMGFRSSEMTQMYKDRIYLDHGVIKLRAIDHKTGSKTGKGRTVSIHADVLNQLKNQMNFHESIYLFPNRLDVTKPMSRLGFRRNWLMLLEECGIEHCGAHSMRKTCATKLFSNKDINQAIVCKSMGFSMQIAMKTYVNFSDKDLATVAKNQSYGASNDDE